MTLCFVSRHESLKILEASLTTAPQYDKKCVNFAQGLDFSWEILRKTSKHAGNPKSQKSCQKSCIVFSIQYCIRMFFNVCTFQNDFKLTSEYLPSNLENLLQGWKQRNRQGKNFGWIKCYLKGIFGNPSFVKIPGKSSKNKKAKKKNMEKHVFHYFFVGFLCFHPCSTSLWNLL